MGVAKSPSIPPEPKNQERRLKPSPLPPPKRRRRWPRRIIYCSVLLAILPAATLLFRNQLARTILPPLLGPVLGLDVRVEEVAISLGGEIKLAHLQGSQPAEWAQIRELGFEELTVRFSPWNLIRKGIDGAESAVLSGGVLVLDLDRPGSPPGEVPSSHEPADELERYSFAWPERLPAIDIQFDRLRLISGEHHTHLDSLHLKAEPAEEGSSVNLQSDFDWKLGERSGKGPILFSFGYQRGALSSLKLSVGESQLIQNGSFGLSQLAGKLDLRLGGGGGAVSVADLPTGHADCEIDLRDVFLEDLLVAGLPEKSPASGKISLSGRAYFPLEDPLRGEASVQLSMENAEFQAQSLSRLEIEASLKNREVNVNKLRVQNPGIEVQTDQFRVSLENLESDKILSSISGSLALKSGDLSRALSLYLEEPQVQRITEGASLDARIQIRGETCQVESLNLASPLGEFRLEKGSFQLKTDSPLDSNLSLKGRLLLQDLSKLKPLLGEEAPELSGSAEALLLGEGPLETLTFQAELRGESLQVARVPLGDLEGKFAGSSASITVQTLKVNAEQPDLHLVLSGAFQVEKSVLEGISLRLEGSGLRSRASALKEISEWLPEGTFLLSGTADGPLSWPDGSLSLQAEGMKKVASPAPMELSLSKEGNRLELSVASLPVPGGRVAAELDGTAEPGFAAGRLALESLELESNGERWEKRGNTEIHFDLQKKSIVLDPPLEFAGKQGKIIMGLSPQETGEKEDFLIARLEAVFPETLPFEAGSDFFETRDLEVKVLARYPGQSIPLGADQLPRTMEVRFSVKKITPRKSLSGSAGDLQIALDFNHEERSSKANVSIQIPQLVLQTLPGRTPFQEPLKGLLDLKASWNGKEITIEKLQGNLASLELSGSGGALFDSDLQVILEGKETPALKDLDLLLGVNVKDLTILRQLAPDLRRIAGSLHLEGNLKGVLADPSIGATLRLEEGEVRYGDIPALSSLQARLDLKDGNTQLSLKGEMGGAPIEISGAVLEIFKNPKFDVGITGTNALLVRTDRARLRADTALRMTGELKALQVTGNLSITDGRVIGEIPLVDFLRNLSKRVGGMATLESPPKKDEAAELKTSGLKLFSLRNPPLKDLRLSVEVRSSVPIELMGNVFGGKVRPEVKLLGTGEIPYLFGSVYLDDFVLYLPATRIRIESGSVRFDEKNPLFPELNMTGTTRMRGYDINVSITGPINDLQVVFSSSPPLPSDQLILLVTTGRPPAVEDDKSDQQALFTVVQYFGMDLLRKIFGSPDVDAGESILDRFDFEAGRNVSRSGRETWEARFRLKRELISARDTLLLVGESDQFDHYNIGLRIVFRGQ